MSSAARAKMPVRITPSAVREYAGATFAGPRPAKGSGGGAQIGSEPFPARLRNKCPGREQHITRTASCVDSAPDQALWLHDHAL